VEGDFEILFDDPTDLGSLESLIKGDHEVSATVRTAETSPGELSGGRDLLEVVLGGSGGAAFQLIKAWIESKVTTIRIKVSDDQEEIVVRSSHAAEDLRQVSEALEARRSARNKPGK
jgi:hypothetical protein